MAIKIPPVEFKLRMPRRLKVKLVEAAKGNNRSENQEIVERLERSFADKELTETRLDNLEARVAKLEEKGSKSVFEGVRRT